MIAIAVVQELVEMYTAEQGFQKLFLDNGIPPGPPTRRLALFNLERHRARPITLDEVADLTFRFAGKPGPRFFHLDPVRVYWYHNIDGRWLAWGQILIQEQTISRNPAVQHTGAVNVSDPDEWMTTGVYKILKVYDPVYQEAFTRNDLPPSLSYFQD